MCFLVMWSRGNCDIILVIFLPSRGLDSDEDNCRTAKTKYNKIFKCFPGRESTGRVSCGVKRCALRFFIESKGGRL